MSAPSRAEEKLDLFDLVLIAESYRERLEIHERLANERGMTLGEMLARERRGFAQIVSTLELLRLHEKDFVALVKRRTEEARRRAASVPQGGRSDSSSPASTTS